MLRLLSHVNITWAPVTTTWVSSSAATGRPADAMEAYRRAAAVFERMSRERPSVVQYEDDLAGCYLNMGNLLRAMGQLAAAIDSYRKGLKVFERLEREHPSNTQVRLDLAVSHTNIGNVLNDMGPRDDALTSYQRALPIHERLVAENPGVHDYESGLAGDLDNIGNLLSAMGHHAEAIESHRRALGMYQRLASSHSSVTRFQDDLAICYMNIGNALNAIGQPAEATESFRHGLEIQERLVRRPSVGPRLPERPGRSFSITWPCSSRQGRWPEARVLLERAVEQQRAAIASTATAPDLSPVPQESPLQSGGRVSRSTSRARPPVPPGTGQNWCEATRQTFTTSRVRWRWLSRWRTGSRGNRSPTKRSER